jgi:phosphate starvation-inducible PhoH-like protein
MKFIYILSLLYSSLAFKNINTNRNIVTKLYVKNLNIYEPIGENQNKFVQYLEDESYKLIIANGAAGSGKTLLACQASVKALYDDKIERIIITRPVVAVEEDIGYLPGTLIKKMDPWTRPIMDIINEYHSKNNIKNMLKENTIEISPLAYMRGRTFKKSIIIADEMQNSSPNQMLMLLTRIGEKSKIIITGDLKQSDKYDSGLLDLLEKIKLYYDCDETKMNEDGIGIINFENKDVLRSELVSKVLKIYNQ